jgi:hypothetical protein
MRSDARARLEAAARAFLPSPCDLLLATNSLRLRFDLQGDAKRRKYFWIDPPWRLTLGGVVVAESGDYPRGEGGDKKAYRQALEAWCAPFGPLDNALVETITVGSALPDLAIVFASGHRVETLSDEGNQNPCWWYFADKATGDVFEAGPAGLTHSVSPGG